MKFFMIALTALTLAVGCSSPEEKYKERQEEAREDYEEELKEAQEDYGEDNKEEAKDMIEDSDGVQIDDENIKVDD